MSRHPRTYDQRYDSATALPLPPEEGALYPSAVHDFPIYGEPISHAARYPASESSYVTEVSQDGDMISIALTKARSMSTRLHTSTAIRQPPTNISTSTTTPM